MSDLYKTKELVEYVLLTDEETRNDDIKLYKEVCRKKNPRVLGMCFDTVLNNMNTLGVPHFETVRRSRQKLQHDNPEIYGCNIFTQEIRDEREKEFKEFARS